MKKSSEDSPKSAPPKSNGKLSRFLKCTTKRVHRSQLKLTDYNPREIDEWARKKLKDEIKNHGLVNKLVWNEKTGNIVSGHQRLSILDELEGSQDYELEVDAVSLSPKQERRLNVFLNNKGAQGTWDAEKLASLIKDLDLDFESMGFDRMELEVDFGEQPGWEDIFPKEEEEDVDEAISELETAAELRASDSPAPTLENGEVIKDPERHREVIEERNRMREKMAAVNDAGDTEFYSTIVFGCREEREAFNIGMDQPKDDKYMDGRKLMFKLGIELPKTERA